MIIYISNEVEGNGCLLAEVNNYKPITIMSILIQFNKIRLFISLFLNKTISEPREQCYPSGIVLSLGNSSIARKQCYFSVIRSMLTKEQYKAAQLSGIVLSLGNSAISRESRYLSEIALSLGNSANPREQCYLQRYFRGMSLFEK